MIFLHLKKQRFFSKKKYYKTISLPHSSRISNFNKIFDFFERKFQPNLPFFRSYSIVSMNSEKDRQTDREREKVQWTLRTIGMTQCTAKRIGAQLFEEKITATFPSVFTRRSRVEQALLHRCNFSYDPVYTRFGPPRIVSLVAGRQVPRCIPQHCFSNESRGNLEQSSALPAAVPLPVHHHGPFFFFFLLLPSR